MTLSVTKLYHFAKQHYTDCRILFVVMLTAVMRSVVMLSVLMLSVLMLSVLMLSVIIMSVMMLNIVTPRTVPLALREIKQQKFSYDL
jgi:hypothetical protein